MIVNYRASMKTRAPFCGLACCGNHFGRCERSQYANVHHNNRKRLMRRYAKHAERVLILREIELELARFYVGEYDALPYEDDRYYHREFVNSLADDYYDDYNRQFDEYDDFDYEKYDPHSNRLAEIYNSVEHMTDEQLSRLEYFIQFNLK